MNEIFQMEFIGNEHLLSYDNRVLIHTTDVTFSTEVHIYIHVLSCFI